jgi:hypothetical protein
MKVAILGAKEGGAKASVGTFEDATMLLRA